MNKVEFTGKVGAKSMSFMVDREARKMHTAWYTLVETTDGRMCTVKDESSPVNMMEAETRYKAIKKGKEFLKRMEDKFNQKEKTQ